MSIRKKKDEAPATLVAYKAMNADMTCRDHKFEVGQTYTVEGAPVLCRNGFHACENPFDVLKYYDLCGSRFACVTLSGAIDREADGNKVCGSAITIDAELSLPDWIAASVKWLIDACKSVENVQAASGDSSKLAASGDRALLAASGDYSLLAASGDYSQLAASGDTSKLAASGDSSKLAASGDTSKLAASGYSSKLAASGDRSKLAASGGSSKLEVTGTKSAAAAVGPNSRVKAAAGTPVAICEYDFHGTPIGFATGVAGKDFPADVWVIAKNGKIVEDKR